jgi:Flp pilus assembly protein TadD
MTAARGGLKRNGWMAAVLAAAVLSGCQTGLGDLVSGEGGPSVGLFASSQDSLRAKAKGYFRANNFGLAERTFRDVLEKNPSDAEAWVGLAAAYDRLGRFDLADKSYDKALAVAGRRPEILNNMGYSRMLRGEHDKAQALFAEAAALAPDNQTILANMALVRTL